MNKQNRRLVRSFLLMALLSFTFPLTQTYAQETENWLIPKTEEYRKRVDFWKRVYSEIPSTEGVLHDPNDMNIIYEKLSIANLSHKQSVKLVKERKEYIRKVLLKFASDGKEGLSDQDFILVQNVANKSEDELRAMAREVRWQQGLSDRFLEGISRSYLYLDKIKEIFKEERVPTILAFLPHVESSFNYRAFSKVGAAGIWQFMRDTARMFGLKVNYILDERLDPLVTARSAARLLRHDFDETGVWPLAITSYNHGVNGIVRAINSTGSTDIEYLVKNYNGKRFGFASQNFFACFIAASELAREPSRYFGNFEKPSTIQYFEIELTKSYRIKTLLEVSTLDEESFHYYNRGIRPAAYRYNYNIPSKYKLKLPMDLYTQRSEIMAKLDTKIEENVLTPTEGIHLVGRGESLYTISKLYKIPIARLIEANGLLNPSSIRRGQKIVLPSMGGTIVSAPVIVSEVKTKVKAKAVKPESKEVVMSETSLSVEEVIPESMEEDTSIEMTIAKFDFYKPLPPLPAFFDLDQIMKEKEEIPYLVLLAKDEVEALPDDITKTYNLDLDPIRKDIFRITVETNETLGHYADWIGVSLSKIKLMNGRKIKRGLRFGQKIELPIPLEKVGLFSSRRLQYHQSIEEDFYENYVVSGVQAFKVGRGDSVEAIAREQEIPLWLIRKYRPDHQDLSLYKGQEIDLPVIVPKT